MLHVFLDGHRMHWYCRRILFHLQVFPVFSLCAKKRKLLYLLAQLHVRVRSILSSISPKIVKQIVIFP